MFDDEANVVWLSEGALGPDEHTVVIEALNVLRNDTSLQCYEGGLDDGRMGVFLPIRAPQGSLVGAAMVLADNKSVNDTFIGKLATPQIRTIMQRAAVLLKPSPAAAPVSTSEAPLTLAVSLASPVGLAAAALGRGDTPPGELSPEAVHDILEFELTNEPVASERASRAPEVTVPNVSGLSLENTSNIPVINPPSVDKPASVERPPAVEKNAPASATSTRTRALSATSTSKSPGTTGKSRIIGSTGTSRSLGSTSTSRTIGTTGTSRTLSTTSTSKALGATGSSNSPSATGRSKAIGAESQPSGATTTSKALELPEGVSLSLELAPFTRLRSGGRTRRFEVLARTSHPNRVPHGFDRIALQRLLTWLGANRTVWNSEPSSFTLNLSITALEDERFPQFIASNLKAHGISAESIGFEIAEPLCLQRRAQVERFLALCDKLGCFVVIDDFSLDSSIVSLLRSKALRLVKIDPRLTSVALKDKLAQAMVVAIAQAVKVLGIHCAAKRVESQAALQWLTAVGCDFAQGSAVAPAQPLESLGSASGVGAPAVAAESAPP